MKKLIYIAMLLIGSATWAQKPELVVPTGHSNSVTAIACVPNSDFVATGSDDNTIILWNVKTKQKIRTFEGHQKRVVHLSIHPKGHLMASSSWDHTIRIWEIATGKQVKQIPNLINVKILTFTADGKNLIVESSHGSIGVRKWNTTNWELEKAIKSKYNELYAPIFQITPNNKMVRQIFSYGKEGAGDTSQFIVSDYEEKVIFFKSKNLTKYPTACISNDSEWMIIGGENTVDIINLTSKKSTGYSYAGRIERVCFSNDSKKIGIYSERNYYDTTQKNKIAILGLNKGEWWLLSERITKNFENNDECFAFTNNNIELISGINDTSHGNLYIWNYTTSREGSLYPTTRPIYIHDIVSKLGISKKKSNYESFARTRIINRILYDSLLSKIDTSLYTFFSNFDVYKNKKKNITISELGHYSKKTSNIKEAINSSYSIMRITNFNEDTLIKNLKLPSFNALRDVFFIQNDKYLVIQSHDEFSIIDTVTWDEVGRTEDMISSPHKDLDYVNKVVATWGGDFLGGRFLIVQSLPEGKLLLDYKTENEITEVNGAKIIGSKNRVSATFSDKTLKIFDLPNGQIEKIINLPAIDYEMYGFTDATEKYLVLTNLDDDFYSLKNQLLIVDWEKGEIVSQIYPVDSTDWVVTSPEGFFDASPGAMKKMYYVQGLETFDLEQLKERYWVPGLMQELLGYTQNGLPPSIKDSRIPLPPVVKLSLKGDILTIKATKRDGGLGKISFFVDNIEVETDLRSRQATNATLSEFIQTISLKNYQRFLGNGKNLLRVVAYEKSNQISTRGDTISYVLTGTSKWIEPMISSGGATPKAEVRVKKASFYGIMIGANTLGLRYASKDAKAMKQVVEKVAKSFIDTTQGKVKMVLFSQSQPSALQPTKENVIRYLSELKKVIKPEDYLYFFFSGHGKVFTNKAGENDFAMLLQGIRQESTDLSKSTLSEFVENNYILATRNELTKLLNDLPARKKIIVMDACGSESAAQLQADALVMKQNRPNREKALDNMSSRTGIYFLASSATNQASFEHPLYEHGFLTYSLLRGIKSGSATKYFGAEAYLEVSTWFNYAEVNTPKVAAAVGQVQQPKFLTPKQTQNDIYLGIVDEATRSSVNLLEGNKLKIGNCSFQDEDLGDILELSDKLNAKLRDESEQSADFWYENTITEGTFSLRGRYKRAANGMIPVEINLYKGKTLLRKLGTVELKDDSLLVNQLKVKLMQEAKK